MAGRGPPPKDPRRKVDKHGSRLPALTPKITAVAPVVDAAPSDLPAEVVPLWELIVAELDSRGSMPAAFRPVDVVLARVLVDAIHVHRLAGDDILDQGITVEGRWGAMPNPSLRTQRDAGATVLRVSAELGLSPAARTRLGLMQVMGVSLLQTLNERLRAQVGKGSLKSVRRRA
jgi:P27 family predicted phage terminase small subunit